MTDDASVNLASVSLASLRHHLSSAKAGTANNHPLVVTFTRVILSIHLQVIVPMKILNNVSFGEENFFGCMPLMMPLTLIIIICRKIKINIGKLHFD